MTQLTTIQDAASGSPEALLRASTTSSINNNNNSGGAEAIKVIVRSRPLSEQEKKDGHDKIVSMDTQRGVIEVKNPKDFSSPPKNFTFDAIYDENSKQIDLYYETFRDLVESVLTGFNGTIFAYGQTGTGKTFTMEGIRDDPELRGVIPNAIDHIFRHISQSTNQQYLVRASYLEIYQEEIRDLLDKNGKNKLELKEKPDVGVYVKDLTSFVTKSVEEILHVMQVGNANRSVGKTNMNEHSSRSHAIFMITVECSQPDITGEDHIRVGRLNLVDLAGSERQSKTGSQGERFKEATKINLSLSALGNVISALVDGKSSHIPYRDSKLTRLLQDSLGGNSKTVMVANIGPASYNFEETLSTLRYANRAKNIKNKPRINEDPKDALLRQFQDEIARLKEMLEKRTSSAHRKRRRPNGSNENEPTNESSHNGAGEEMDAEEYLQEQQRKLDDERKALEQNKGMREEEKQRLLENLEDRQKQLVREQEAQAAVAAKIKSMQSKLLSGSRNLLDQTKEQQKLLQARRIELAEQKRREREILQQLEAQEDNTAEIHQTFASLQQEVEVKTKKLQKLFSKLQQIRYEIQDNSETYSKERQQLEQSIGEMNKELKLKWLIVENFIPISIVEKLRERAIFDENESVWRILKPGEQHQLRPGSRDTIEKNGGESTKTMIDSGLGPGISEVSTSIEDGSGATNKLTPIKRPVSMMGLRRPASDFERNALMHLRQRGVRSASARANASSHISHSNTNNIQIESYSADKAFVPDQVIRFCGENVINFGSLQAFQTKVKVNFEDISDQRANSATLREADQKPAAQSVVIEVTKIPVSNRSTSNLRRLSTSTSSSKNARARSAHGRGTTTIMGGGGSPAPSQQSSASSAGRSTPTSLNSTTTAAPIFPKARGSLEYSATMEPIFCETQSENEIEKEEKTKNSISSSPGSSGRSVSSSPAIVAEEDLITIISNSSTNSSNSNDQGLGDEILDDSDDTSFETFGGGINELEASAAAAALKMNFSFYENIPNMDCFITPQKYATPSIKFRQKNNNAIPPPLLSSPQATMFMGKPPIYPTMKKTKIPILSMSNSFSSSSAANSRENNQLPDGLPPSRTPAAKSKSCSNNGGGRYFDLNRSYHGSTATNPPSSSHFSSLITTNGSIEKLAEKILTPKEECEELLRACKEGWRRPISTTMNYYPERSVIMPIRRSYPSPHILTPNSNYMGFENLPSSSQQISPTIQKCLTTIMKAGESLKNIEEDVLFSPLNKNNYFAYSKPKEKPKIDPNPDSDKYKNPFGGRIIPIERKVALFRIPRSTCICCKFVSVLHRLHQRIHLRRKKRVTVRIAKKYVVIRDRCHCFANTNITDFDDESLLPIKIPKNMTINCFVNDPPFTYVIWIAAISFMIRVILFIFLSKK